MPISEQIAKKEQSFWSEWDQAALPRPQSIDFAFIAESELRDRADLVLQDGFLSLYQKDVRKTFAMITCPAMSPALQKWFTEFRQFKFPIKKGSVRLRVSPTGKNGVWLDFANEDIKQLFEQKSLLLSLLEKSYVEVGQRRKKLFFDGERLRLGDPEYHPWTETETSLGLLPLNSLVASFSQTGSRANRRMVQEIRKFAEISQCQTWAEFGAGCGNLTFPLSDGQRTVHALEFDELSLAGLKKTLQENPQYQKLIQIESGDFQRKKKIDFSAYEGVLVNPPRSGLMNFLEPLKDLPQQNRPKSFIYMSCYRESFIKDSLTLRELGYHASHVTLVDQFPQSPHCEILSLWQR